MEATQTKFKVGERVTYCPRYGEKEKGIVKHISENPHSHYVFVVYKCGNNWDHYYDYIAARTEISDLKHGWL